MKKCPKCGREYQDTNSICTSDGTALEKAGDALVGQTLADKYRVEEHLSEGGMGTVYRGTHILMDKTVAIKVLHPSLAADDKIVQRFSREARAASRISHPHALNVTDFGESENGVVFLVMEYLRGRTLKEVIHQDGQMPLPRVVEIMRQVTGALAAAHAEGVVHRDLKSDNIMLVDADNGQDWAKVLDFGIAKIQEPVGQDPALTAPNLIIGTPQYMSPEQCSQASELDARSDIYSLGVILYEMLAGHVPFSGDSPTAVMMKHLQEPPPSLQEERVDLSPAVSRVVMQAMAKRPEDRYQTVGELADALALAAVGEGHPDAAVVAASAARDRATARIVVPTESNSTPRATMNTEYDESTIVVPPQPGRSAVVETESINPQYAVPSPPPENFHLGRVLGLSVVALLVVFAIVYAITSRNSNAPAANNQNASQPASDPNGQPVMPAQAPTGQSEKGITTTPSAALPNTNTNTPSTINGNYNSAGNINRETGTTLPALVNANTNANSRRRNTNAGNAAQQSDNAEDTGETEAATPEANKNSERHQQPTPDTTPAANTNSDTEPPPPPAQKKKQPPPQLPKPTSPANDNAPSPDENPAG